MAEDDLYGDLDTSWNGLRLKSIEVELEKSEKVRRNLEEQLSALKNKERSLQEENEQLVKNISCLFNTAKAELSRKEKWIERLRNDLQVADRRLREAETRR